MEDNYFAKGIKTEDFENCIPAETLENFKGNKGEEDEG